MGKSQKQRAIRRHNPMRVPDTHLPKGLASASSSSSKNEAVLPIIQKMESPEVGERKWACVAVSNIIQNDPSTRRLLQGKNVVGALIARLTDSEEEVVVEAMGSLRNLCIDGGYDICAEMYNKNILTPLKAFVPKISTTLEQYLANPKAAPENAAKLVYEFADNVITTLWCLSETSNKALNAINALQLVPFLMSFLACRDRLPLAPVTAAAQCLYVLSDDNEPAIDEVRSNGEFITSLLAIARTVSDARTSHGKVDIRRLQLGVLASGVLKNISPLPLAVASDIDIDKELVTMLLPVLQNTSLRDATARVPVLLSEQANEVAVDKPSLKNTPKSDHRSPVEIELESIENQLRTTQLALEILTAACATLPDPDVSKHDEEADEQEDEGMEEEEIDEGVNDEMSVEGVPSKDEVKSSVDLLPSLVPVLIQLAEPTALSFPPLANPSIHPPTTSALGAVHIAALECLNNIFLSLARNPSSTVQADTVAAKGIWDGLWKSLGLVGTEFGLGQERRKQFWELAIGVLWGVSMVWKGFLAPDAQEVELLKLFCNSSEDERVRVKCIGTLECLAQCPTAVDGNKIIAEYLFTLLPTDTTPPAGVEPAIQAGSALIDIYSDETFPYDVNFRANGYLERLVAHVDAMKKLVKGIDRRKPGGRELRLRGEEVRDNLVAFLKYRKALKL